MSQTSTSRWCLQHPDGTFATKVLERSEEWAWIVGCHTEANVPSRLTEKDRQLIQDRKDQGYRAVEVMLVPVRTEADGN